MKNSFLIYYEYEEQLSTLSDEQLGVLLRAIFKYEKYNEVPKLDGVLQLAFMFIKGNLDRDREKYDKRCETSANNGKLGGRPPSKKPNLKPNENLKKPKKADNDNVNDNVNVNVNDNEIVNDTDIKKENKKEKIHFADLVTMTNDEYEKLIATYGKSFADQCIYVLDNYKGSSGKKYKSDYRAILTWVVDRVQDDINKKANQPIKQNGNVFFDILREEGKMK